MSRRIKIIIIVFIILLIGLGLGLGLYFGLKNNSNSSTPQNTHENTLFEVKPPHNKWNDKWTPEMCNQYLATCQDNVKKQNPSDTNAKSMMDNCLNKIKAQGCK